LAVNRTPGFSILSRIFSAEIQQMVSCLEGAICRLCRNSLPAKFHLVSFQWVIQTV